MPLIYVLVGGLTIFGYLCLPNFAAEFIKSLVVIFVLCAVSGFVFTLVKNAISSISNHPHSVKELAVSSDAATEPKDERKRPPAPVRPTQSQLRQQIEQIHLEEDEFLHR